MQSGSERNHKMEGVCKSKMRNRLLSETTNKVVYVCANARLRDKVQAPNDRHIRGGTTAGN
jgi:hypothetical protein